MVGRYLIGKDFFDNYLRLYQTISKMSVINTNFRANKKKPSQNGRVVSYYRVSGHGSSVVYDILVNRKSPISLSVGTGSSNCKRSWLPSPGPPK